MWNTICMTCGSYPCRCYVQPFYTTPILQGCVCPPTSEQTCQNPTCPRKPFGVTSTDDDKEGSNDQSS